VAKQELDGLNVDAVVQQVHGEGIAEAVPMAALDASVSSARSY
jgi:hypothetical protein